MEKGTYRCRNFSKNCEYARGRRDIKCVDGIKLTVDGKDFICPKNHPTCQHELRRIGIKPPTPRWLIIAVALLMVVFGIWLFWPVHHQPVTIDLTVTAPSGFKQNLEIASSNMVVTFAVKSSDGNQTVFPVENKKIKRLPIHYSSQKIPKSLYTRVNSGPWVIHTFESASRGATQTNDSVAIVQPPAPPAFMLQSALPLVLESDRDSLVLSFTLFAGSTNLDDLKFSATVDPSDRVMSTIRAAGANRTVTLSRNQRNSGPVKLAARLVTTDGRETNQIYEVTVAPPPPPTLAITVASTAPPDATVHPGDEVAWNFTIEGGPSSEKPLVSAESLSPSTLPQTALQLAASDETHRKYQLTARTPPSATGRLEVRISASLDGGNKDTILAFKVDLPDGQRIKKLLQQARKAWLARQYSEAIDYCNQALAIDSQCFEALTIKGGVFYSSTRHQEALDACNQALKINAQYADAWFTKGASEEVLKKTREAIDSYEKFINFALPEDPRIPDVKNRVQALLALLNGK